MLAILLSNTLNKWEHLGPTAVRSCLFRFSTLIRRQLGRRFPASALGRADVQGDTNRCASGGSDTADAVPCSRALGKSPAHRSVKRRPEVKKQVCLHLAWLFPMCGRSTGYSRQRPCLSHVPLALSLQCITGPHFTCWHLCFVA